MKKLAVRLTTIILIFFSISIGSVTAIAKNKITVTGGGQGTFADGHIDPWDLGNPRVDGDLDGDGDIDGSYFGIGIAIKGDSVDGHFVCGMWGNTDILGLPLMAVEGRISSANINVKRQSITFSGVGTVDLGKGAGGFFKDIPFTVTVTSGGPGRGTLQLTVIGAFDGTPGDTIPGNGNYDLPVERVSSGQITIHRSATGNEGGVRDNGEHLDDEE